MRTSSGRTTETSWWSVRHNFAHDFTIIILKLFCCNQCDQIWRIFATLASILKYLVILQCFFHIWHKFEPTLAISYGIKQIFNALNGQILNK